MLPPFHGRRRTLTVWRRTVAAALLALQAVIALSPMLERRHEVRLEAHVEALGSRHLFAHDEATCIVCAARTLASDVPAASAVRDAAATGGRIDIAYAVVAYRVRLARDNHSRAPPTLG